MWLFPGVYPGLHGSPKGVNIKRLLRLTLEIISFFSFCDDFFALIKPLLNQVKTHYSKIIYQSLIHVFIEKYCSNEFDLLIGTSLSSIS